MAGYLGIGGFFVEPGVMLSILLLGMCVAAGWTQQISHSVLLAVIGISGSLHGTAFSGALIGVEAANTAVLVGYLLGLAGTLAILALVAGYGFSSMGKGTYVLDDLKPKLIGAALAGVGGFIIFEELEGVALTMAGFG
jgi:urease accessory protein